MTKLHVEDSPLCSLKERQIELEQLFAKNQLIPRIKEEFLSAKDQGTDFERMFEEVNIDPKFGIAVLVQMALHKRCDLPTLVGTVRYFHATAQEVADGLLQMAMHDFIDWNPELSKFIVKFTISDDVQAEIDRFQFPLPMLVQPIKLTDNKDSGYLTFKSSVILKDNHTDDDICLDHLNRMNQVKMCLDLETAHMVKNQWKNLDRVKPGETKMDYDKRVKAFAKYDKDSKRVMELIDTEGDGFYLTHRFDKRGRTYSSGHHVNYQGNPWNKAVIQFHNKEVI